MAISGLKSQKFRPYVKTKKQSEKLSPKEYLKAKNEIIHQAYERIEELEACLKYIYRFYNHINGLAPLIKKVLSD